MKILGIEASAMVASAAVVNDDVTMAEASVNTKKTHSQTLLPLLDRVMGMAGVGLEELDAIAVSSGPGSFTGLRIGSATAKGLGLVLEKPLINVPTLDALAYNLYGVPFLICPMLDARRNQVYTGLYSFEGGFCTIMDSCCLELGELVEKLNGRGERVVFLGDGVPVAKKQLEEQLAAPYILAPPHVNSQRAASVAALGAVYYAQARIEEAAALRQRTGREAGSGDRAFSRSLHKGRIETAMEHLPTYLRKAQAERELDEARKRGKSGELALGHGITGGKL